MDTPVENAETPAKNVDAPTKKAWHYFSRGARLKCPVCGVSPIFCSVKEVKSVANWFETLEGCPRCNYVYDQEPGYFLLALWAFDYGVAAVFGIVLLLMALNFFQFTTVQLLIVTLVPTAIVAVLIVRHAKAFYLAMDHYFFHKDEG